MRWTPATLGRPVGCSLSPEGFIPSGFFVAWIPIIAPETDKGYSVTGESIKARLEAVRLRQVRGLPGYRAQA